MPSVYQDGTLACLDTPLCSCFLFAVRRASHDQQLMLPQLARTSRHPTQRPSPPGTPPAPASSSTFSVTTLRWLLLQAEGRCQHVLGPHHPAEPSLAEELQGSSSRAPDGRDPTRYSPSLCCTHVTPRVALASHGAKCDEYWNYQW